MSPTTTTGQPLVRDKVQATTSSSGKRRRWRRRRKVAGAGPGALVLPTAGCRSLYNFSRCNLPPPPSRVCSDGPYYRWIRFLSQRLHGSAREQRGSSRFGGGTSTAAVRVRRAAAKLGQRRAGNRQALPAARGMLHPLRAAAAGIVFFVKSNAFFPDSTLLLIRREHISVKFSFGCLKFCQVFCVPRSFSQVYIYYTLLIIIISQSTASSRFRGPSGPRVRGEYQAVILRGLFFFFIYLFFLFLK